MSVGKAGRPSKYSISDKQEAFGLYINGLSHREISEKLNERYDWGISMRTIQKWSEKMGWPEQLKQVELDLAEEVKKTVVRDMGARMAEVEEVRQEFLGRLRLGNAEIRGHEFAKLTDMLNSMSDFDLNDMMDFFAKGKGKKKVKVLVFDEEGIAEVKGKEEDDESEEA